MNIPAARTFQWVEYESSRYPPSPEMDALGEAIYANYSNYIVVEFPTPKTDRQWEFTPLGWVGSIPIIDGLIVTIKPKTPLANLFRMWEYAYRLKSFKFLDGVIGCTSFAEFYQNLAGILSNRVIDRANRGLYRTYLGREDRLPYVSGRLDVRSMAFEPWRTNLQCSYEEHTADVEDNQILCCTLSAVARSGLCEERVLAKVRRAYRELVGCTTPAPITAKACIGRLYNRLNDDYRPLHGLCRFFLEHRGPEHHQGDNVMMPFLMNMAHLYELFVAEWLRLNLPSAYEMKEQHILNFGTDEELKFKIDVVIFDRRTSAPVFILDSKYKAPERPGSADVHEVRSYAEALGCPEAILVYPAELRTPMDVKVGSIRVRTMTFAVNKDIEMAGKKFMDSLFSSC